MSSHLSSPARPGRRLNRTLGTDYLRLEECADGVAYAQLVEALHPGAVPLHRLNFGARREEERQRNVALVTEGFHRAGVTCPLDLRKLSLGKFVDHNEFLQWLLGYIEADAARITALGAHNFQGALRAAEQRASQLQLEKQRKQQQQRLKAHGVHLTREQLARAVPARPPPSSAPPATTLVAWPAAAPARPQPGPPPPQASASPPPAAASPTAIAAEGESAGVSPAVAAVAAAVLRADVAAAAAAEGDGWGRPTTAAAEAALVAAAWPVSDGTDPPSRGVVAPPFAPPAPSAPHGAAGVRAAARSLLNDKTVWAEANEAAAEAVAALRASGAGGAARRGGAPTAIARVAISAGRQQNAALARSATCASAMRSVASPLSHALSGAGGGADGHAASRDIFETRAKSSPPPRPAQRSPPRSRKAVATPQPRQLALEPAPNGTPPRNGPHEELNEEEEEEGEEEGEEERRRRQWRTSERRAEMEQLVECLEAELSDRLTRFVALRTEVRQLQAGRDGLQRGLMLAEQLCTMHAGSRCADDILSLLRTTPKSPLDVELPA